MEIQLRLRLKLRILTLHNFGRIITTKCSSHNHIFPLCRIRQGPNGNTTKTKTKAKNCIAT